MPVTEYGTFDFSKKCGDPQCPCMGGRRGLEAGVKVEDKADD